MPYIGKKPADIIATAVDTTTGTFSGALDVKGAAVFNEDSADVDFRVESDNLANALFVQGSDGAVGIGTNVPASKLDLYTATASGFNYPLFLSANNADAAKRNYVQLGFSVQQSATGSETGGFDLKALRNNSAVYLANYGGAAGAAKWQFYTEGTERVRIHTNGVLSASNGIALGVGTANTASNVLDDYEEGTWTPGFDNVAIQEGSYVKIGSMVFCTARIQTTAGGASGTTISGLPFTTFNSNANRGGGLFTYQDEIQTQTFALLVEANSTSAIIRVGSTDKQLSASKTAFISFSYRVA